MATKEQILGTIEDLVSNFLYYERKDDEDLSPGEIEQALADGTLTLEDMVEQFRRSFISNGLA